MCFSVPKTRSSDCLPELTESSTLVAQRILIVACYRVLRIPKEIVERYLTRKAGRSVTIEVPERAERRRKSPQWEDRAIRNLAKAGLQNGVTLKDKTTYQRIAERARLLTSVPENGWADVVWYEGEE